MLKTSKNQISFIGIEMVDCDIDHNFPTLEVCNVGLLAKREYCLYQPPLEISLKLVGMKKIRTGEIG